MNGDSTGNAIGPDFGAALKSLSSLQKTPRLCAFGRFIESSPPEFQQALQTAMDSDASHRSIYVELTKAGVRVGRDTFTLHRVGRCICTGETS